MGDTESVCETRQKEPKLGLGEAGFLGPVSFIQPVAVTEPVQAPPSPR